MSGRIRCVVFDLDDTLYLERDYVRSGFAAVGDYVRDTLAVEGFQDLAWELFESGARGDIFDRALVQSGLTRSDELIRDLVQIYRTHEPRIALEEDAVACLDELDGNCKLGLVSDGPIESQRAKVDALGIGGWIKKIVLTADLGSDFAKPHPRAFREIEQRFEVGGSDCVYVADNPTKDFGGPRSLGWRTVRVRRPSGLYSQLATVDGVDLEVAVLDAEEIIERAIDR